MPPSIIPEQVSSYERDGILFPIDVLSRSEVKKMAIGLGEIEERMGGKAKTEELHQLFLNFRWAYDLVTHPKVLDAVESILGPDILLWATSVFSKPPRDPGFISWHQDRDTRDQTQAGFRRVFVARRRMLAILGGRVQRFQCQPNNGFFKDR